MGHLLRLPGQAAAVNHLQPHWLGLAQRYGHPRPPARALGDVGPPPRVENRRRPPGRDDAHDDAAAGRAVRPEAFRVPADGGGDVAGAGVDCDFGPVQCGADAGEHRDVGGGPGAVRGGLSVCGCAEGAGLSEGVGGCGCAGGFEEDLSDECGEAV